MSQAKKKKKSNAGRPTKYKKEYCEQLIDYFSIKPFELDKHKRKVPNPQPNLFGFAALIGVSRDTIHEWTKVHKEFSDAMSKAKDLQANFVLTNALLGLTNSTFSQFMMKNVTDWRDKKEVDHTSTDGSMTPKPAKIEIVPVKNDESSDSDS